MSFDKTSGFGMILTSSIILAAKLCAARFFHQAWELTYNNGDRQQMNKAGSPMYSGDKTININQVTALRQC